MSAVRLSKVRNNFKKIKGILAFLLFDRHDPGEIEKTIGGMRGMKYSAQWKVLA